MEVWGRFWWNLLVPWSILEGSGDMDELEKLEFFKEDADFEEGLGVVRTDLASAPVTEMTKS